ncbi:phosphatase [Malaciobacter molluscorum LMG 25693]|uniref:ADP-ribose binding protein (Macro domain) n=1 Tax=Malaciobacter molluscorum LMG 25693 TaxID=870501 RepID=A0A2G1DJK2_9BACT|nr:macro domain-containing protein [Malaciobacter molluscorum]AXX92838.1 putative ADP-ribose binding protein (Macro domain) [Malaciobacter molluscorum LMG 25693]PHO18677.1 phosphatase [Malaciobacter molluscorum LMG 25693]
MNIIYGDLIDLAKKAKFDVIIHGCNCFCTMGAGIAKSIKKEFPKAYAEDCKTIKGDRTKLGTYTKVKIENENGSFYIINAYTQYNWNTNKINADYEAIKSVFSKIKKEFYGKKIAYPMIGAGLARGDWKIISNIIDDCLKQEDHTLVKYQKNS